jgi:cytochrome c oxidase assembly protein subunit 15
MILSVRYRKDRPVITVASVAAFVLVIFQGWLGGMVVRSGLTEWIITIHMLVAMVIVGLLIFAAFEATSTQLMITLKEELRRTMVYASVFLLVVTLMQLVLGTQVREAIDVVSKLSQGIDRGDWLSMVGRVDGIHRSFSWLVLLSSGYLLWFSYAKEMSSYFRRLILGVFALVISQIIIGIVLAYAGMPASFQVLHLLGSAVLISANLFSATSARINP